MRNFFPIFVILALVLIGGASIASSDVIQTDDTVAVDVPTVEFYHWIDDEGVRHFVGDVDLVPAIHLEHIENVEGADFSDVGTVTRLTVPLSPLGDGGIAHLRTPVDEQPAPLLGESCGGPFSVIRDRRAFPDPETGVASDSLVCVVLDACGDEKSVTLDCPVEHLSD
jgi:hypothetical protein